MIIRDVERKDLPFCVELLNIPEFVFPDGSYPDLQYLEVYLDSGLFFVAEDNSKIIGCMFGEKLRGKIAMLWYFVVDPLHRGKGIGQRMIKYFENACKEKQVKWIVLYSPTSNPKSLRFYEKMGYDKGQSYVEYSKEL